MRCPEDVREPAYDAQIEAACWRVKMVKLADVIDNMLDSKKPTKSSVDKFLRAIAIAERYEGPELAVALGHARKTLAAARGG